MFPKISEIFMHFDFSAAKKSYFEVKNGGFFGKIRSKGRSGSEKCDFFSKNAEVEQTPRGASPNGSPDDPESTKIGQILTKIEKIQRKCERKNACGKKHEKILKKTSEMVRRAARRCDMVRVGGSGAARQGGGDLKIPKGNCKISGV